MLGQSISTTPLSLQKDPTLTIVIPALNEELSIASIIERCLAAKDYICLEGGCGNVEIIVVSDGSTDKTATIAQEYQQKYPEDVRVIIFEKNQGYGAAIKEGFRVGQGDYVGFIDADGTCDPVFFAKMCASLKNEPDCHVVLGSRIHPGNQMPLIRKIGNIFYATILSALCNQAVADTASGMRVIRKSILEKLYPLPNGLHFTPAMSARALFMQIRIKEIPMTYRERVGRSKLNVVKDGVRFLGAIAQALVLYNPAKLLYALTIFCVLCTTLLNIAPLRYYSVNSSLEDWMIYRLLLGCFFLSCAFFSLIAGVVVDRTLDLLHAGKMRRPAISKIIRIMTPSNLLLIAGFFAVVACLFAGSGVAEFLHTGHTTLHWSRAVVSVYCAQTSFFCLIMSLFLKFSDLWAFQISVRPGKEAISYENAILKKG